MPRLHEDSKGRAPSRRRGRRQGLEEGNGKLWPRAVQSPGRPSVLGATARWVWSECRVMYLKTCQEGGSYVKCPCHTQNMTIIIRQQEENFGRDDADGLRGRWPFPLRSSSVCIKHVQIPVSIILHTQSCHRKRLYAQSIKEVGDEKSGRNHGQVRPPGIMGLTATRSWDWPCFLKFMQMFCFSQPCNQ